MAEISDERVTPLDIDWAASEFWLGGEDPDELAGIVRELRAIARSAAQTGYGMYAWALV